MFQRLILFVILTLSWVCTARAQSRSIESRYEDAVKSIMVIQEGLYGIKFYGSGPKVSFKDRCSSSGDSIACYSLKKKTIILNPFFHSCDISSLEAIVALGLWRNKKSYENAPPSGLDCSPRSLLKILAHEAGHYYLNTFLEKNTSRNWLTTSSGFGSNAFRPGFSISSMVWEGVSEYLSHAFGRSFGDFDASVWERVWLLEHINTPHMKRLLVYHGGHALVGPILDEGVEKGILYLADHQFWSTDDGPGKMTLENLPTYQRNAITALSQGGFGFGTPLK